MSRRPCYDAQQLAADLLADCGKTISVQQNFDGPHVWHKPGLSGYLVYLVGLVCFVYLVHLVYPVSLVQPNKQDKPIKRDRPDRPNRPNEQVRLADFFSILLAGQTTIWE
jgi:hypothetical protein